MYKYTRTCKRQSKLSLVSKYLVTVSAIVIIMCSIVGGSVAWLIAKTEPIKNTFTYGDINITLTESDTGDNDGDANTNEYIMLPGKVITKDPKVTVQAGSEDCWLFVKLDKSENFDSFMTYTVNDAWKPLEDQENVYYIEVSSPEKAQEYGILLNDTVTVNDDVTKVMLNSLDKDGSDYPTLTVTAYAVQRDSDIDAIDTAAEAWQLIS